LPLEKRNAADCIIVGFSSPCSLFFRKALLPAHDYFINRIAKENYNPRSMKKIEKSALKNIAICTNANNTPFFLFMIE